MAPPLIGVRVLALEQAVSVPLTTRHLADLGADVIKIERPDGGDFARAYDTHVKGLSTYFVWLNRGKRSITLNLKDERAIGIAKQLARSSDVFVQNLGPGAAERLGLGPDVLQGENERLIYCSLTGYGHSGPYRDKKAYDLLLQGESGLINVSGSPTEPAKVGISAVDISGGMYAHIAIIAALYERETTGRAQRLELSLLDAITEWMQVPLLYTMHTGRPFPRSGLRHNMIAPYGPYRCGERGSVNIGIQNQREWERFCRIVLGDPDMVADPRFADNERRVANHDALAERIEAAFERLGVDEVLRRLEEADIPYGQVREVHEVPDHPQLQARDRWMTVDSPAGALRMLKHPIEADGWGLNHSYIPALGEHTEEILRELGMTGDDISDLRKQGVI
ncbi:MAG: CaiB/BaiF CoA-transferase family protein [Gemmatimonadota bacterium]